MKTLTDEEIQEISYLVDDDGFESFVMEGDAEEFLRGTSYEPLLMKYLHAREKFILALRELGIDV